MEGIKNLIIDLGGVIVNLTRNRCIEAFEQLGVTDIREKVASNYRHKDLFMQLELGYITRERFYDGIRQLSKQPLTNEQIDSAWIAMLGDVPAYKLDLLLDLKKRYNTYLLSNTNVIHWNWIAETAFTYKGHQPRDFFDRIYLSYELHMIKPNTDIFEYVLNDAGLCSEETLLLDDSLPNCRTAEAMRMKAYNVNPREDWSPIFGGRR